VLVAVFGCASPPPPSPFRTMSGPRPSEVEPPPESKAPELPDRGRDRSAECKEGMADSCYVLAKGALDRAETRARGLELLERSCELGIPVACQEAGYELELEGPKPDLARAARLYKQGCDRKVAESCANQGRLTAAGKGGAPDPVGAVRAYDRGCGLGFVLACHDGAVVAMGWPGGGPVMAAPLFTKACDRGHAPACAALAELVAAGRGVPSDAARAAALRGRACDGGVASACTALGAEAVARGVESDAALFALERGCELGDAEGCHRLGLAYAHGVGGAPDPAGARGWFARGCTLGSAASCQARKLDPEALLESGGEAGGARRAELARDCDGGRAGACADLARRLAAGEGGPKDPRGAAVRHVQACELGVGESCVAAGRAYLDGRGVRRDAARARRHYERACSAGLGRGCTGIGLVLARGRKSDVRGALRHYAEGCRLEDGAGCANVAVAYLEGVAVRRDLAEARRAGEKGCALGDRFGCAAAGYAQLLAGGASPTEQAEARRAVIGACRSGVKAACAWRYALDR
jgi:TPR repeat protein